MNHLKLSASAVAILLAWVAAPASAQIYGDDTYMGNDTPEHAMAWAIGFCQINSLEETGYSSYEQCVTDIFNQTAPTNGGGGPDNQSYYIEVPSGAKACRYYGQAPGRIGGGGC